MEEPYIESLRRLIQEQYKDGRIGRLGFGELLCYELHENGLTFISLAEKWGISLPTLGELIKDHCDQLQELPIVNHEYEIE